MSMTRYINETEFITKIGLLYCLWEESADGITVFFLGRGKNTSREIIKKVKDNRKFLDRISVAGRKSKDIENKINGYLDGRIKNLDFKIGFLTGTPFQKKIWNTAVSIPYGKTVSYKELAGLAGYRKAWRAAGSALKENPIILVVPCHRVIKSNGDFGKFGGGEKLKVKEFLIGLEKSSRSKEPPRDYSKSEVR